MPVRAVLCLWLLAASLDAASNQFEARYVPLGAAGAADLLAVDGAGNLFVVATVEEPSGEPQIRAIKTDGQGNVLASFDFGSSGGDTPLGIAIDPAGNPVITGTTYSADFPLVAPLVSSTVQDEAKDQRDPCTAAKERTPSSCSTTRDLSAPAARTVRD